MHLDAECSQNHAASHIPDELKDVLESTPDTLSGAVRFTGTRVPVQALLYTLLRNHSIDYFLEGYPGVTREQAEAVVRFEHNKIREIFGLDRAS